MSIIMTDPGVVESVSHWLEIHSCQPSHQRVDEQMAVAAKTHHQYIPGLRIVPVSIETYEEDSSCDIELVAKTSTGCILGGSALGAPQIGPVDTGVRNYWKLWSVWDVWIQIFR